jgi:hypothetical protein
MSRSAGEHEFREVRVTISLLSSERAIVSVHTRKRRGADLVWHKRLGAVGVDLPNVDNLTTGQVLNLCGEELLRVAQRTDT